MQLHVLLILTVNQEVDQEVEEETHIDSNDESINTINTNATAIELEGESLHKSIDLSVNRVTQQPSSDVSKHSLQNSRRGSKVNSTTSRSGSQASNSRTDSQLRNMPSHNEVENTHSVASSHTGSQTHVIIPTEQQPVTRSVSQSGSQPTITNETDIDAPTASGEQTAIDANSKIQPEVEVGE